jgi:diaminopropionate ammonia-lyase
MTLVGVEPTRSDCMLASIEAGRAVQIPGPYDSIMAGLNCGTPSLIAWPLVSRGMDLFCAVEDERAMEAMRMLADAGIVAGESGAAGLAGALDLRDAGRLPANARILLVSTEGATDPVAYERVVGRHPELVADP